MGERSTSRPAATDQASRILNLAALAALRLMARHDLQPEPTPRAVELGYPGLRMRLEVWAEKFPGPEPGIPAGNGGKKPGIQNGKPGKRVAVKERLAAALGLEPQTPEILARELKCKCNKHFRAKLTELRKEGRAHRHPGGGWSGVSRS